LFSDTTRLVTLFLTFVRIIVGRSRIVPAFWRVFFEGGFSIGYDDAPFGKP